MTCPKESARKLFREWSSKCNICAFKREILKFVGNMGGRKDIINECVSVVVFEV